MYIVARLSDDNRSEPLKNSLDIFEMAPVISSSFVQRKCFKHNSRMKPRTVGSLA